MTPTRRLPRRDPYQLFTIHADFAAGLPPATIAAKHGLPLSAVAAILRRRSDDRLPTPFHLRQHARRGRGGIQAYWVGYIAAAGRLFPQGPAPTLVLTVDPRDTAHVAALVEDLCAGHPTCEWCRSSRDGLQAYIRDRDLGRMLADWGVPEDPAAGSVPVGLIPAGLLDHFVRGYLEGGGRLRAGRRPVASLAGPGRFVAELRRALDRHAGVDGGVVRARADGTWELTYAGPAARRLLQFAYQDPVRSLPRAERVREKFGPASAGTSNGARSP
ncbi:MAG: hypothetical protein QN173_03725 [Armatimonadota bacterium]|nr:hypothetical protein [Armatimonadota bacterium]MDR7402906.1 hypothetical protein [Armatimonadota bacterium]MDR7404786.1 hypothetical protein [Armatimonadota bacterium]MDR7436141.1 hypothetical protein [Armatimonadota bacterium]MDR7472020.1 hypothetical protein [Armatimonadota bacterium]